MKNRKGKRRTKASNPKAGARKLRSIWHVLDVDLKARRGKRKRMPESTRKLITTGLIALGVVLSFVMTRAALQKFLYDDPEYTLRWIDYDTDGLLTKEKVLDAAELETGGNLLKTDLDEMRASLLAMPEVKDIRIVRDLPDRLSISIRERRPVAWIACRAMDIEPMTASNPDGRVRGVMVDSEGILLECRTLEPRYVKLPVIHVRELSEHRAGQRVEPNQVRQALELVRVCGEMLFADSIEVKDVFLENNYSLLAHFSTDAKVTFGLKKTFDEQVSRFRLFHADAIQMNKRIDTVNLLVNRNFFVTYLEDPPPEADALPKTRPSVRVRPAARGVVKRRVPRQSIMKSDVDNIIGND